MTLSERLQTDLTQPFATRDELRRDTLRMAIAAAYNAEKNARRDLDRRRGGRRAFARGQDAPRNDRRLTAAGRDDTAAKETGQDRHHRRATCPSQLTDDELRTLVAAGDRRDRRHLSPRHGQGHGALMPKIRGRADGKVVSALVAQELASATWPATGTDAERADARPLGVTARAFTRRDAIRLVIAAGALVAVWRDPVGRRRCRGGRSPAVRRRRRGHGRHPRAARATFDSESRRPARRTRRATVEPQYDYSPDRGQLTAAQQLAAFEQTVAPVDAAYAAVLTPEARPAALRAAMPNLTPRCQRHAASLDEVAWTALRGGAGRVLELAERQEVRDTLTCRRRRLAGRPVRPASRPPQRALGAEIVAPLSSPTRPTTPRPPQAARDAAAAAVAPVTYRSARARSSSRPAAA